MHHTTATVEHTQPLQFDLNQIKSEHEDRGFSRRSAEFHADRPWISTLASYSLLAFSICNFNSKLSAYIREIYME
jgi:hypothetical protein